MSQRVHWTGPRQGLRVRQTRVPFRACLFALLRNLEQTIWLPVSSIFFFLNLSLFFLRKTFNIKLGQNVFKIFQDWRLHPWHSPNFLALEFQKQQIQYP